MDTVDILDIDEALKDDPFIYLEDKKHDDVSNIIQQWKSNNYLLLAQQQEQANKFNSRTFTRPRRKPIQNLEQHFAHPPSGQNVLQTPLSTSTEQQQQQQQQQKFTIATPQPMLNMEIGGLVTPMHKSFLQDTSPPLSICSSMDVSIDRMNNSLITSADFTNINFLQSTNSLDFNDQTLNVGGDIFNLANKTTSDGYTLSDMIRDRKALESLTMSGDGTLIKDSQIGQIDDISLALSKTASGYSTMDNSTESIHDEHNNTISPATVNTTTTTVTKRNIGGEGVVCPDMTANIMHRTMLLSDDVISDTTFDLVESSLCASSDNGIDFAASTSITKPTGNETFKKPWPMDETVCLPSKGNATFEFTQLTPEPRLTAASDTRCETPENVTDMKGSRKIYESTPHASAGDSDTQNHTPTTSKLMTDDENLSPIVGSTETLNATRMLSKTFNREEADRKKINSNTFSGTLPRLDSIEQMLDDMENPNETYEKIASKPQQAQQSAADIQMQNVLDLAYAEEELLASNNDQEFENMLEEFSKVEVNAEHVKMKKSLETIKRRFNRETITLSRAPPPQYDLSADMQLDTNFGDLSEQQLDDSQHSRSDVHASIESKRSLLNDCSAPSGLSTPSPTSAASAASSVTASCAGNINTSGERLLSRRSRLYDNVNFSTISNHNSHHSPSRALGASFTVQKREDNGLADATGEASSRPETENKYEQEENEIPKTEANNEGNVPAPVSNYSAVGTYKLAERRERDRDRFKTIKIVKGRNANDDLVAVNVPCIDDDTTTNVVECNDTTTMENTAVFNNNNSEVEYEKGVGHVNAEQRPTTKLATSKINPNFLTFKKTKDKPTNVNNLTEIATELNSTVTVASNGLVNEIKPTEPLSRLRSRSRPRYISGLQKLNVVKATSAGDLDRQEGNNVTTAAAPPTKLSHTTQPMKKPNEEAKSPLGAKSKSFHNLSSNFGFNGNASGLPRTNSFGMKKPATFDSKAAQQIGNNGSSHASTQQADDPVFKVPKLVSGLRAPGVKRAGLVRPSSGFYSLNSLAAKGMPPLPQAASANDIDSDGGRHSPSDSMSSASSRGSLHNGGGGGDVTAKPAATSRPASIAISSNLNLTKIITGATGIPKPSGLRPPATTALKRSGLPKPGTVMVRR